MAFKIIEGKGATCYGIGSAVSHILSVVLFDQRGILTVSAPARESGELSGATVSVPRLAGGSGVITTLPPSLNEEEKKAPAKSAALVRSSIEELDSASSAGPGIPYPANFIYFFGKSKEAGLRRTLCTFYFAHPS